MQALLVIHSTNCGSASGSLGSFVKLSTRAHYYNYYTYLSSTLPPVAISPPLRFLQGAGGNVTSAILFNWAMGKNGSLHKHWRSCWVPVLSRALKKPQFIFVKDSPHGQPPETTNRQPPIATNRQLPTNANRQPPTATNHQLPTANRHQPPPAHRQPPIFEVERVP